jgi:hypothetical protein
MPFTPPVRSPRSKSGVICRPHTSLCECSEYIGDEHTEKIVGQKTTRANAIRFLVRRIFRLQ